MRGSSLIEGIVIYDSTCGVCETVMDFSERRDVAGKLEIIAYQLADLDSISPGLTEKMADKGLYFVRKDGTRFGGARGIYEMLKMLPGMWGLFGTVMAFTPLSILSEPFYRVFAANRHYVSRKLGLWDKDVIRGSLFHHKLHPHEYAMWEQKVLCCSTGECAARILK